MSSLALEKSKEARSTTYCVYLEMKNSDNIERAVYTVNGILTLEQIFTHYFCDTLFSHSPLRRVVSGESSVGREEGEKRELHSKPYKIVEFKEMLFCFKIVGYK